jgi:hypothetical protein
VISGAERGCGGKAVVRRALANRTAQQNGARLDHSDVVEHAIDFVVTVRVSVLARTRIPHLPQAVTAQAHAGPVR